MSDMENIGDKISEEEFPEELADEGVLSGVQAEDDEYSTTEPFNPDEIKITSKNIALDAILRRIKNGTLKINPDFQRNFVWDGARKSQLIESMILKIPLPMFYVAEDRKGVWEVVDGLQRLSSIRDFVLGPDQDGKGDKLIKLEFLKKFNGQTFFSLAKDPKAAVIVNNIMETELSFTIINPDTSEIVKRNIFKRLNTGGMRLSDQEIRHALYEGESTKLLKKLVKSNEFKIATGGSVNDGRMAGRELILRFLAFYILGRYSFKGGMDDFLSSAMIYINDKNNVDSVEEASNSFFKGIQRSVELFGVHAFRASTPKSDRKAPINKALFEVWINILSSLTDDQYLKLIERKFDFFEKYFESLKEVEFSQSISKYAGSASGSQNRFTILNELIDDVVKRNSHV